MVWPLGLKKPGLTDRGVATGVTKFRMASGGLIGKFQKALQKISDDFEKYFGHFRVFRKIFGTKSFRSRQLSRQITENLQKCFWKLQNINKI